MFVHVIIVNQFCSIFEFANVLILVATNVYSCTKIKNLVYDSEWTVYLSSTAFPYILNFSLSSVNWYFIEPFRLSEPALTDFVLICLSAPRQGRDWNPTLTILKFYESKVWASGASEVKCSARYLECQVWICPWTSVERHIITEYRSINLLSRKSWLL